MESILTSIKKMLQLPAEYNSAYDEDIIIHINSVFMILRQAGVGPAEGFFIEDDTMKWRDFIADPVECNAVKTYMYAKVRLIFDPPQSSAHIEMLKQTVKEFEWRLNFDSEVMDFIT